MRGFLHIFRPWERAAILVLIATYVAINLFPIGTGSFVINLNNFLTVPLALGTVLLAWLIGTQTKSANQQALWIGLAIGWTMWATAEIWWAIATLIKREIPYPSGADFLWLAGYPFMYFALWKRLRSLPKASNTTSKIIAWSLLAVLIGLTISLIFWPIISQTGSVTFLGENAIALSYPLLDIILMVLVIRLMFTYQQGRYGQSWQWIAGGCCLFALADLLYSYAIANNLYYPEHQPNLMSTLGVDVPYNFSYLTWVVGLLQLRHLLIVHQPADWKGCTLTPFPNTHLLVFTRGDDTVINVSRNYWQVYPAGSVMGKSLSEVLGLSPGDGDFILQEIKSKGVLEEKSFQARVGSDQDLKELLISGVAVLNPPDEYAGATLLIRLRSGSPSPDHLLREHEKKVLNYLLSRTNTGIKEQRELAQLLTEYYQAHLTAFYNRVLAEGGGIFADAFIAELQRAAQTKVWQMDLHPIMVDVSGLSLPEIQKVLYTLFETGRQFLAETIGEENTGVLIAEIEAGLDQVSLEVISPFVRKERQRNILL